MSLEPGSRLGHYEIVEPMPGGVSESYKAADTRSNRTVTLKVYPQHVWDNASVKQQLEREIQSVAALKHPHIVAPTEIVHEAGADYLVTDYVEGETLAERLKHGPLEVEEAVAVAVAIADALDKAHRQGVVHRGLNPSTIVLTAAGAKLIDFGFARVNEPSSAALPVSALSARTTRAIAPSVSAPAFAAPYLAPEQIAGTDAEACTDIFAFGAVLYEMLTGRPAFEGKTSPILAAAIQTVDPEPVSKLRPETPPALDYAVRRCLAKDPKQRFRTALDLTKHLQWIGEGGDRAGVLAADAAGTRKRNRLFVATAAALVLLTASLTPSAYRYLEGGAQAVEARYVITSMADTANNQGGSPVTVSPDGRWITAARFVNSSGGFYALPMEDVTPKMLLDGHIAWAFFWAPDSKSFGFFEDGKLKTSDVSGAPPQTLSDAPFPVGGGAWGTRGVIVFSSGGVLHKVQASGGQPAQISSLDPSLQESEHLAPYFLPDGVHYLYVALSGQPSNSAVYIGSIDSKDRTRLFASESPALYAAAGPGKGYLLFNRGTAVFAQPFDPEALKLTGEPTRLSDAAVRLGGNASGTNLSPNENKMANIAVSQNGVLAYRSAGTVTSGQTQAAAGMTLVWFNRSGAFATVGTPASFAGVDIAPDGKRFAVHQHEGDGGDSWFFDSDRMQRLTFNTAQDNSMPIWSRDGTKIAFGSKRNGKWGVYVKASDGTGQEDLIIESELSTMPMSWSPDGKLLVYWVNDPKTRGDLWMVPMSGERKPVALLQTPADETLAQVSPDGKWIAYQSDETGINQIYVSPFPSGSGNKSQISTDGGVWPRWRGDGKELFFNFAPNIMAADIRISGQSVQPGVPRILFPHGNPSFTVQHSAAYHRYGVTADGQRFLMPQPAVNPVAGGGGLAATLAGNVDRATSGAVLSNVGSINVVLNWAKALKKN